MVNVEVQGGQPSIVCPPDVTIECNTYDPTAYGTAQLSGDCSAGYVPCVTEESELNNCGLGKIIRTYSVGIEDEVCCVTPGSLDNTLLFTELNLSCSYALNVSASKCTNALIDADQQFNPTTRNILYLGNALPCGPNNLWMFSNPTNWLPLPASVNCQSGTSTVTNNGSTTLMEYLFQGSVGSQAPSLIQNNNYNPSNTAVTFGTCTNSSVALNDVGGSACGIRSIADESDAGTMEGWILVPCDAVAISTTSGADQSYRALAIAEDGNPNNWTFGFEGASVLGSMHNMRYTFQEGCTSAVCNEYRAMWIRAYIWDPRTNGTYDLNFEFADGTSVPITNASVSSTNPVSDDCVIRKVDDIDVNCKQIIYVENNNQSPSITFPPDLVGLTGICSVDDLLPTVLNSVPTFVNTGTCSQLGYDYEDVVVGQGACLTITRTWTVIDWCTRNTDGTFKTYEGVQTISTMSGQQTTVNANSPQIFPTGSLDCERSVTVSATANAGCTNNISWNYSLVDVNQNAVIDIGNDFTYTGVLPVGEYQMTWTASDGCNASGTFVQSIIVESTKAPKPVCLTNYFVSAGAGETLVIVPSDINGGSSHHCYPTSSLILSFSEDGTDNGLVHTCGNSFTQDVTLWVMLYPDDDVSLKGNCTTSVTVECTNMIQGITATVNGSVFTENHQMVEDVEVGMGAMPSEMTDDTGEYAFDPMPVGGEYEVVPNKDIDHLNGVSTLDMIMIQRHLLGIELLDSPYKQIAADVDNSQKIDGIDLVELRKLILGIYKEFPNNTSWRFFDESKVISESDPWSSQLFEAYRIHALDSDMEVDFIGVKIGDVNNDVGTNGYESEILNSRSQRWPLVFTVENKSIAEGQKAIVNISAKNYERVSGWQGTLEYDQDKVSIVNVVPQQLNVTNQNFNLNQAGMISMSYGDSKTTDIVDGNVMFQVELVALVDLRTEDIFNLSSEVTRSEAYRGFSEEVPLILEFGQDSENRIIAAVPNPFVEYTTIEFTLKNAGEVRLEFYDTQGRLLHNVAAGFESGRGSMEIEGAKLDVQGVIYIKMITENGVSDFKMIKL